MIATLDMRRQSRMVGSVVLSTDGRYRYALRRVWDPGRPARPAVFVMLNPSTADAYRDDPTVRRCVGFARAWGCTELVVVNLYAYRTSRPVELATVDDPIGPANDEHLVDAAGYAALCGGPIVAAWGTRAHHERVEVVLALPGMTSLAVLALTRSGQPRHPLYLPRGLTPQPWRPEPDRQATR